MLRPAPERHLNPLLYRLLWHPLVRAPLARVPLVRRLYGGWSRRHPFDVLHGVDTSGYRAPPDYSAGGTTGGTSPYGGSQPSIIRRVLASLPIDSSYGFVDIGCGKGRPLLVASEFRFAQVVGVELSSELTAVARQNAAVFAARHPQRPAIRIIDGDATQLAAPCARVVFYMYHPFNGRLVDELLRNLERQLQTGLEHAFFVYYNPVHGVAFDRSSHFRRWSAHTYPYAADELGYGPDGRDTVVIWQAPQKYPAEAGSQAELSVDPVSSHVQLIGSPGERDPRGQPA